MIKMGEIQKLQILRFATVGAYLTDEDAEQDVLLPKKYLPDDAHVGMTFEVFIYRDSKDRIIATTETPKILMGEVKRLEVVDLNENGAFLDWGLEKDLMVPIKEQTGVMKKGEKYLVALYLDTSDRLCATMNVYSYLEIDAPYGVGEWVEGTIFNVHPEHGAFVAVDDRYCARIPNKEIFEPLLVSTKVKVRVTRKHEDGKLELSLREVAHIQRDTDSEAILALLEKHNGFIPANDNSEPEFIKSRFNMSKKAFKRAIGKLLKEGVIEFFEEGIRLKETL